MKFKTDGRGVYLYSTEEVGGRQRQAATERDRRMEQANAQWLGRAQWHGSVAGRAQWLDKAQWLAET